MALSSSFTGTLVSLPALLLMMTLSCGTATQGAEVFDPAAAGFSLHWANATIDHFNFVPKGPQFPLRVYVMDTHWDRETGPILFYTGNEAPIEEFIENTGWMAEIAPELKAMVVFAEHRYYGSSWENGSWPFGPHSFDQDKVAYLTVEQALADFADVIRWLRNKWQAPESTAVVSFGGSYGANLAMWMRIKYPWVVSGAIASSVSVQKHLLRRSNIFWQIVTEAYHNVSATCPKLIRAGWDQVNENAANASGRAVLQEALGLCAPPASVEAAQGLMGWIQDGVETMVQYGYPYPTSFYNPVPGYPFKVACERMIKDGTPLGALRAAVDVYYNYTGAAGKCFDQGMDVQLQRGKYKYIDATSGFNGQRGWGYQTCTEVFQPMPTNGITDMLLPSTPNKTALFANCEAEWGTVPRPEWEEHQFGGPNVGDSSNIFLSAGQLDPWRAGGIRREDLPTTLNPSIELWEIIGGAHHLDLRASNPLDPPTLTECRLRELAAIKRWIKEWAANPPKPTDP